MWGMPARVWIKEAFLLFKYRLWQNLEASPRTIRRSSYSLTLVWAQDRSLDDWHLTLIALTPMWKPGHVEVCANFLPGASATWICINEAHTKFLAWFFEAEWLHHRQVMYRQKVWKGFCHQRNIKGQNGEPSGRSFADTIFSWAAREEHCTGSREGEENVVTSWHCMASSISVWLQLRRTAMKCCYMQGVI